jgi:hypothetical protein
MNKFIFTALIIFSISTGYAQSYEGTKACDNAIYSKYNRSGQDKYGNSYSSKVVESRYFMTEPKNMPGYKFGNNSAFHYGAWVEDYENGSYKNQNLIKLYCVVNPSGKVIGLERQFD